MLGLDGYGSGSESESENEKQEIRKVQPAGPKSVVDLPPPSTSNSSSSKISLPPPKATKRAPKKITIGLPALSKDDNEERDDIELERPAAKRQKTGAGASSLLTMLPAPKQKVPVAPQPERVLGGGKGSGLIFSAKPITTPEQRVFTEENRGHEQDEGREPSVSMQVEPANSSTATSDISSLPFLPPSLAKGKANVSLEDKPKASAKPPTPNLSAAPPVDFFSLGIVERNKNSVDLIY